MFSRGRTHRHCRFAGLGAGCPTGDAGSDANEPVNLFGFTFDQSERYKFGGELMAGWSHDGAQAALGFEKQGRVGMAILSLSGRVSDHVRYYVSSTPSVRRRRGRRAARRITSSRTIPTCSPRRGRSSSATRKTA